MASFIHREKWGFSARAWGWDPFHILALHKPYYGFVARKDRVADFAAARDGRQAAVGRVEVDERVRVLARRGLDAQLEAGAAGGREVEEVEVHIYRVQQASRLL